MQADGGDCVAVFGSVHDAQFEIDAIGVFEPEVVLTMKAQRKRIVKQSDQIAFAAALLHLTLFFHEFA